MIKKLPLWFVCSCAAVALTLAPGQAIAGEAVDVSFGYAFSDYLEDGAGNAPLGLYLSLAGPRRAVGLELDLAWHRDAEDFATLNTFTATAGPRFLFAAEGARPFVHVLGGVRNDRIEDFRNTAWGLMTGGGVDLPAGQRLAIRLGADFQIFWDEGENVKTLRLNAGLTF